MMTGMILTCINTAIISSNILGEFNLNLQNESIALLKNSYESTIIRNNYAKANINEFETYEKVIKAVSTRNVYVAFLNADYACWIQIHGLKEQKVNIVQILDYEIPINALIRVNDSIIADFFHCFVSHRREILPAPTEYFRKTCDAEVVYYENVLTLLGESLSSQIFVTITLGLILYGVVTEILIIG